VNLYPESGLGRIQAYEFATLFRDTGTSDIFLHKGVVKLIPILAFFVLNETNYLKKGPVTVPVPVPFRLMWYGKLSSPVECDIDMNFE